MFKRISKYIFSLTMDVLARITVAQILQYIYNFIFKKNVY